MPSDQVAPAYLQRKSPKLLYNWERMDTEKILEDLLIPSNQE
jgi:hypothetical protein